MKKNSSVRILEDKNEIKKAEDFLNDGNQEKWETGEFGRDAKHAVISKENLSGSPTTIRIPESMKNTISLLAQEHGLTLNSYIRMILADHIKKHKNVS